jgi:hypothetical protein
MNLSRCLGVLDIRRRRKSVDEVGLRRRFEAVKEYRRKLAAGDRIAGVEGRARRHRAPVGTPGHLLVLSGHILRIQQRGGGIGRARRGGSIQPTGAAMS